MLAMQYEITLPADYDMRIIRNRVAATGHLLDSYPGLGVKVFLIRERGVDGSTTNQYAPFYLWADSAGAASFLWSGAGFTAILRDFGRPLVQTWIGGTVHQAPDWRTPPAYAVRKKTTLTLDADIVAVARSADTRLAEAVAAGETQLGAYGIDPRTWELVTVTLHERRPEVLDTAEVFQVLHAALPERRQLPDRMTNRLETVR